MSSGRRRAGIAAIIAAFALVCMLPAGAFAADRPNSECAGCHGESSMMSNAFFDVGAVNMATACRKCHLDSLVGTHPLHYGGGNCGTVCHSYYESPFGASLISAVPTALTANGSFASTSSPLSSSVTLHTIHARPRWIAQIYTSNSKCASCHAAAACTACHNGSPAPDTTTHSLHGSTAAGYDTSSTVITPWVGDLSPGVVSSQYENTVIRGATLTCLAAGCHSAPISIETSPSLMDSYTHGTLKGGYVPTTVTKVGTWREMSGPTYTMSREAYTNYVTSTLSIPFEGQRVAIISDKDPYRGFMEISIDSSVVAVVDQYNVTTRYQRPVWVSPDLAPGAHTITVKPTGTKNPASRGVWIAFDQLQVYSVAVDRIAPDCVSCHTAENDPSHGSSAATHTLDAVGSAYNNTTQSGCTDSDAGCHGAALTSYASSQYHSLSPCTGTCHSSLNHDDAAFNDPNSCIDCHNGTYDNALNVVQGSTWLDGHYNETTHTVAGLGTALSAGGTYSATCADCHNPVNATSIDGLYNQHQGLTFYGSTTCYDCHNAGAALQAIVTDGTRTDACVACHTSAVMPAMVQHNVSVATTVTATEYNAGVATPGTCKAAGCHSTTNLHALHKSNTNATPNGCMMTGCHDATKQGVKPTAKSCGVGGACHNSGTVHPDEAASHMTLASTNCVVCHHTGDLKLVHVNGCGTCHGNPLYPSLPVGKLECTSCHNGTDVGLHLYDPTDPNHYDVTTHTAMPFTAAYQGTGADGAVAAESKECSLCHTASMKAAHATTSVGAISCTGCHTNLSLNSSATVDANWPVRRCTDCHDTGAATAHDTYATTHVVAAGTCASTGASCHDYTDLAKLHDKSWSGGVPKYQSCSSTNSVGDADATGCHVTDDARPTRWASNADPCGSTSAGCHTEKTPTNHGGDHGYTVASDYTQTADTIGSETGCAGSGAGCHGTVGAGRNAIGEFHAAKTAGCTTTDKCHGSSTMDATWKAAGSGADCSRCHANNFVNAKDTMPLYQPASAGHYNETTHTASNMTTAVAAGGTASATCATCHSTGYRDAHGAAGGPLSTTTKGAYVTCQECHGYNAAVSSVTTDAVRTNNCGNCHNTGVLGAAHVVHSTTASVATVGTGTGCASTGIGCHNTSDLHAIHKDADSCALTGCHNALNKSLTAASTSCGQATGCHLTANYTAAKHQGPRGLVNGTDTTHTAGTNQMTATYSYNSKSAACSACHASVLNTEHTRGTSTMSGAGATSCLQCHNDSATTANIVNTSWPTKNSTTACSVCHANTDGTSAATAHGNVATHASGTTVAGCTGMGAGCHGTAATPDLTTVHTTGCALTRACHSTTVYNAGAKNCTNALCHAAANYSATTYAHNAVNGTDATHTVTGASMNTTAGTGGTYSAACSVCHSLTLKSAHTTGTATASLGWTSECTGCHNATSPINVAALVAANGTWTEACTGNGCHTTTQSAHVDGGSDVVAVAGTESGGAGSCATTGCHTTTDLHALHRSNVSTAAANGCSMADCHDAAHIDSRPTAKSCGTSGTCHNSDPIHPTEGAKHMTLASVNCVACHHSADLKLVHVGGCGTCHGNSKYPTLPTGKLECISCHDGTTVGTHAYDPADPNHYDETTHTAAPFTAVSQGTGADGAVPAESKECSLCHTSTLKIAHSSTSTSGGSVTCVECHNDVSLNSSATVAANWPTDRCTDCHDYGTATAHDSYATTHTVAVGACAGTGASCHNYTDLAKLHDKSQSGGAPKYQSCSSANTTGTADATVCHVTKDTKPARWASNANPCGSTSAGCHTEKTPTNHGGDHGYTVASDYTQTADTIGSETGCAASGAGCHDSATTGDAIATFHADVKTGCTTADPCHSDPDFSVLAPGSGADCSRCHGGTAAVGRDATPLYQAASAGHYGETTHTASNMTTAVAAGGTASATCATCHSTGYRDAHGAAGGPLSTTTKGAYVTCQECHGYNAAVSSVTTDAVRTNNCGNCHSTGVLGAAHVVHSTTAPVANVGTGTGCASTGIGCHNTSDLHAIHKDADSCALTGCHNALNKSLTAASTSCGQATGCHLTANYTAAKHQGPRGLVDGTDTTHTAGTNQMTATVSATQCSVCHAAPLNTEHARTTSVLTGAGTTTCLKCHNDSATVANIVNTSWPTKNTTTACSVCHDGTAAGTLHASIATSHTATSVTGCTALGAGCHGTSATPDIPTVHNNKCNIAGCHTTTFIATTKTCNGVGCHASGYNTTTYAHNAVNGSDATHTVAPANMTTTVNYGGTASAACSVCHTSVLVTAHDVTKATASLGATWTADGACRGCHNATSPINVATLVAANGTWTDSCTGNGCHNTGQAAHVDGGADALAATGSSTAGCGASGIGCHTTYDLHALHKNAGCAITNCHTAANIDKAPTVKTCGEATGCHTSANYDATKHQGTRGLVNGTDTTHTAGTNQMTATYTYNSKSAACSVCHAAALNTEHSRANSTLSGVGATTCLKCHNDSATVAGIVNTSWPTKNSTTSCSVCHANTDGTSAATAHGATAAAHTATSVTGCTALGTGCHGTTATPDLTTVHTTGCGLTRACHSTTVYNPGAKDCTNALCHSTSDYNTTTYAHKTVNGTEATHTVTGASMTTTLKVGTGVTTAACSVCHSTTLAVAHDVTKATASLGTTWTADGVCRGCHNATSPVNVATMVTNNTWTDTCLSGGCHNIAQQAHVDGGTDTPAVTGTEAQGAGTCQTTGCHTTLDLHALHKGDGVLPDPACSVAGCHDASNIDKRPTSKSCGVGGLCHTTDAHDPAAHTTLASANCVVCHESGDLKIVHGDICGTCHGNAKYPTLPIGKLECISCHTTGIVGTHVYTPHDPNHYTGTETTHTASSQGGTETYSCVTCHSMEMRPEHITKTSTTFTAVPGTYADKCIACHEAKVDGLGTYPTWNKTCDACHAVKHDAMTTRHDATAVGGACYQAGSTVVTALHSENFDSVTAPAWPATWTKGGANTAQQVTSSTTASSAPNAAKFASDAASAKSAYFEKTFDTSALTSPRISFSYRTDFPAGAGTPTNTTLRPTGASTSAWPTLVGAATAWEAVDDVTIDNATTYVACDGANQNVVLTMPDTAIGGTINSVTAYAFLSEPAADTDGFKWIYNNGAGEVVDGTTVDPAGTAYNQYTFTVPAPTGGWNQTAIDALSVGLRSVRATNPMNLLRLTQVYVVVNYTPAGAPANPATNYLKAQYSTTGASGPWTDMLNTSTTTAWSTVSANLPQAASVLVRFSSSSDQIDRITYVDDISVAHDVVVAGCHDTADVAAIHNNSASTVTTADTLTCRVCHANNTAVPTTITCQDASCHGAGAHAASHTAVASPACLSCHSTSNNVQVIHAGLGDGCNVCHGGGGYTDIHTGKTAECATCHDGIATDEIPVDSVHYTGTETSHTAGAVQTADTLDAFSLNATCATCHDATLYSEHTAATSLQSGGKANVCENCHLSTAWPNSPTIVSTNWPNRNTTTACISCHAADTKTNLHGSTNLTTKHAVTDAALDCGASGAGCHPVGNVAQVGTPSTTANVHTTCASCHGTASRAHAAMGAVALGSGCASNGTYCHAAASYASTANHATDTHTTLTGNEAIHTADATNMSTNYAYTNKDACSDCHSATLGNAHKETSTTANLGTGRTAWNATAQSTCRDCHNAAATTNYAASGTVVKANWTNNYCSDCHTRAVDIHNTYGGTEHNATTSGCTLTTGCHGYSGSQTMDIRTLHDTANSGCTASGPDKFGTPPACHQLDKQMTGTVMTCGDTGNCHNGHTQSNHGPDHDYTAASNYTQTVDTIGSEKGCTNSGSGCHTSAATGDAVTTFHAARTAGCTTSDACHGDPQFPNVTWRTGTTGDCIRCHGGATDPGIGADRQSTTGFLYEAASAAHYNEATHTATVNTAVNAGGTASATCNGCHSQTLRSAHGATGNGFSSTTKGTYITCQECHAYTNVTPLITDATHSAQCAVCHVGTVLGATHVPHGTPAPVATVGTGTGCATTGNGCHPSSDLHVIHKDAAGCTLTGCHDAFDKSLTASTTKCGQATGCHLTTQYTATQHNGSSGAGLASGDDTDHHQAAAEVGIELDGATYTQSTLCSNCHTLTMKTAHATTSLASDPTCATGGTGNTGCHNQTTPVNATPVVTSSWTAPRNCNDCHTANVHVNYTTAAEHNATQASGCTLGTCHSAAGTGAVRDVRILHDARVSGCSANGTDGLGWAGATGTAGACHELNKSMTTTAMQCGSGATGLACHTSHTAANHGTGGGPCLGCHGATSAERLDKMVNDTTTYHHVLDGGDGQTNLTSTSVIGCRSCHVDHAFTTKATNLKTGIGTTIAAKTDYSATTPFGICLSCHTSTVTRTTTAQKAGGITAIEAVSQADYNTSAHNYAINNAAIVGFGTPTPTDAFQANCIKCHNNGDNATGVGRQNGSFKIAPHLSAENRLASALGAANVGATTVSEENLCFKCHTGAAVGNDGYGAGAMSARSRGIQAQFALTGSKHNVAGYAGIHTTDEYTAAPASITQVQAVPGWWTAANAKKHVECDDCHDVHQAQASTNDMPNDNATPRTTLPAISGANKGVWGVTVGGTGGDWGGSATVGGGAPVGPTYTKAATAAYEWQMCLKCHSRYAWGNVTPPAVPSGGMNGYGASTMTDVGKDFDPANYAYHPLFRAGLNTPATSANANWNTGGSAGRRNISGVTTNNGLSNTFVDGWLFTSRVTCSDCHGNSNWTATSSRGPHGSGQKWLLRGANTAVKVTIASGAVNNCNSNTLASSFCQNCHRSDVYGNGAGANSATTMYSTLSRADHPAEFGSCDANTFGNPYAGCTSCHGGRPDVAGTATNKNGLIHGSSAPVGRDGGDALGKRFCNGAAWDSHQLGQTGTIGCSTWGKSAEADPAGYSSCTQHGGTGWGKSFTAIYNY